MEPYPVTISFLQSNGCSVEGEFMIVRQDLFPKLQKTPLENLKMLEKILQREIESYPGMVVWFKSIDFWKGKDIRAALVEHAGQITAQNLQDQSIREVYQRIMVADFRFRNASPDELLTRELKKKNPDLDTVRHILTQGVNLEAARNDRKFSALLMAVCTDQIELVRLLIGAGANVNYCTPDGQETPVTLAMSYEVISLLVAARADFNKPDRLQRTALTKMIQSGNIPAIQLLIPHTHDLNRQDLAGDTYLHLAAKYGRLEVVSILLDNAVSRTIRNTAGKTPLQCVQEILNDPYLEDYDKTPFKRVEALLNHSSEKLI